MSELNSGKIKITNDGNIIMQFSNYHNVIDSDTKLYYKHQADKVITELKAQKAQAEDDCAYWKTMAQKNAADNSAMAKQRAEAFKQLTELKEGAKNLILDNYLKDKEIRHHKYKRCLANAEACMHKRWRTDEGFDYARSTRHMKKWLEFAEQFKEKK